MSRPEAGFLLDGEPLVAAQASAIAASRGLAYGEGLFETVAVMGGRAVLWKQHMQRLEASCRRLGLPLPDVQVLEQEGRRLCSDKGHERDGESRQVLKIVWAAAAGGRGYQREVSAQVPVSMFRLLSCHPWPDDSGFTGPASDGNPCPTAVLSLCQTRLAEQPLLAGMKHLNRLEQVLAARELQTGSAATSPLQFNEGLMLSTAGVVIEGVRSNLFVVKRGEMFTPGLDRCGVAGVLRGWLLEQAGASVHVVPAMSLDAVCEADELFVTNSVIGICPVSRVETGSDVYDFACGPLTLDWQRRYQTFLDQTFLES